MKGYIKISVIDDSKESSKLAVGTDLSDISKSDKVLFLDSFMKGLKMDDLDVIMALAIREKFLNSKTIEI